MKKKYKNDENKCNFEDVNLSSKELEEFKTPIQPKKKKIKVLLSEEDLVIRGPHLHELSKKIEFSKNEYFEETYSENYFQWLKKRENRYQPKDYYLSWHSELTMKMRAILVDWIFEVAQEYSLYRETAGLTINFIDRFLCKVPNFPKKRLQLLGLAALSLSTKMEEQDAILGRELHLICDKAFSVEEIYLMESLLLEKLEWNLMSVTIYSWMKHFLFKFYNCDSVDPFIPLSKPIFVLMMHYGDCSYLDYKSLRFEPSVIAASSFYMKQCQQESKLLNVTGYNLGDLKECISYLQQFDEVPLGKHCITPEEILPIDYHDKQYHIPGALPYLKKRFSADIEKN